MTTSIHHDGVIVSIIADFAFIFQIHCSGLHQTNILPPDTNHSPAKTTDKERYEIT
ncbi:hypothetical protein D3C80_1882060 [compost metagenome]